MIKLTDVSVSFKDVVALDIKGEIIIEDGDKIGVIGSNGAGKSTLINAIIGRVNYKGTIENTAAYNQIGVLLQKNEYNSTVSIKLLIETILNQKIRDNLRLQELISFFNFEHCLSKRYRYLSGGEKQKLTIILVLMQAAKLTIYDEVTTGLDFETRNDLMEKLSELYQDTTDTMILVSHYFTELEKLVNKILLLDKGNVIAFGTVDELFKRYCGDHIVILEENETTREFAKNYKTIAGPKDRIVISSDDKAQSDVLLKELNTLNQAFSLKYKDIEVMTLNAKEKFYGGINR